MQVRQQWALPITRFAIDHVRSVFYRIAVLRRHKLACRVPTYPNPSTTGSVNVVFENTEGTRDVTLMDLNGRMIKQWKSLSGNTIQIDNLGQGIYSLRIMIRETGEQSIEKIVVNKN